MGKKKSSKSSSSSSPPKIPKHEKKPQIHNLNKIVRPKVFITESSNFKNLVQELTGNGSSPTPPQDHAYQENSLEMSSFDSSSCFSTLEGSPADSLSYLDPTQFMDLESLLMGIDSVSNNSCYYGAGNNIIQQEVCVYDYDISGFI